MREGSTEPLKPVVPVRLERLSTDVLRRVIAESEVPVVLWPVGSTEPHGPHLPLATDVVIASENAWRAAVVLRRRGITAFVAPALPYGVTQFAAGFSGAVAVPSDTLVALLTAAAGAFLADGFEHVCLVNHHLEPGQLAALEQARAAIAAEHGPTSVTAPQVVSRRWGAQLGAELRSGSCHAGRYETSLLLAARPEWVDSDTAHALPAVNVSLSDAIADGAKTYLEAGAADAYIGAPAEASATEGEALFRALTEMVVTEVSEAVFRSRSG